MMKGFREGYISIRGDLALVTDPQGDFQKVDDYMVIASIQDFNFPYEEAIRRYSNEIIFRGEEFSTPIENWFLENPHFFEILNQEKEKWVEKETLDLEPYLGAVITGVDTINFSDHIRLWYFTED